MQVEFEKSGVAIPSLDFGAKTKTFPKARGVYLNPVKGSLACPGTYAYEWTVLSATSPLVLPTTDKPFLTIPAEQLVSGATYELQLAVRVSFCLSFLKVCNPFAQAPCPARARAQPFLTLIIMSPPGLEHRQGAHQAVGDLGH